MVKKFFTVLGLVVWMTPLLRADVTVSDGSPDTFRDAVSTVIGSGGGTILVTTPIVIGDTNGTAANEPFDGQSLVTVSGGSTNSIFLVQSGTLTLSNLSVIHGLGKLGGAIQISPLGSVTAATCTFSNNFARGTNGDSAVTITNSGNGVIGKSGARGQPGDSGFGGAIYNLGSLALFNCHLYANGASGGTGGDGADGQDAGTKGGNGGASGAGGSAAGGAVYNRGSLFLSDCTFSGNFALGGSGGIGGAGGSGNFPGANGMAAVTGIASGGGLFTATTNSRAVIINSTFDHNIAEGGNGSSGGTSPAGVGQNGPRGGDALGGGIENSGVLSVTNSTFFENSALGGMGGNGGVGGVRGGNGGPGGSAIGGGIYNSGSNTLVNCTLAKNTALGGTNSSPGSGITGGNIGRHGSNFGGQVANVAKAKHGLFSLRNTLLGAAPSGGAAYGTFVDAGHNLIADKTIKFKKTLGSQFNLDPKIGDLAANGGPTLTIALQTNSPAIDQIPSNAPAFDQRGSLVARPQLVYSNDFSDIGAYELDLKLVGIVHSPQSTNVVLGSNVTFSVVASGEAPLYYQWFFNGSSILGATSNLFSLTNVQSTNQGNYQVLVTNSVSSAVSAVAVLTVATPTNSPPMITLQPLGLTVGVGSNATFSVTATGAAPLYYQWYFLSAGMSSNSITGATNPILTIVSAQLTNQGYYNVAITNRFGSTNSGPATLFVTNVTAGP